MLVKVKDTNFVRDTETMVLSNTDFAAREEYYNKVKLIKRQKEEINNIKDEISSVRNEVSEIKNLLLELVGKERNV